MKHNITHKRSQGTVDYAFRFASEAHEGQLRKYTNEPYIVHPVAVAKTISEITEDIDMICAAMLHDTIEDTDVEFNHIQSAFGFRVANFVNELTDITTKEDGNRALRKSIERRRLARVSAQAQTIKLADLIDNTSSIIVYDEKLAKTYIAEKAELLKVLSRGSGRLRATAWAIVQAYYRG